MQIIITESQLNLFAEHLNLNEQPQWNVGQDFSSSSLDIKSVLAANAKRAQDEKNRAQFQKDADAYYKEHPDQKNYSQGRYVYQKNKGWYSGTPLEKWLDQSNFFQYVSAGSLDKASEKFNSTDYDGTDFIKGLKDDNTSWYFFENGDFVIGFQDNTDDQCEGKWSYGANNSIIIKSPTCGTFTSVNEKWVKENSYVNCAEKLVDTSNVENKILKFGCKTPAVLELQKLLGMEEKYQTGYFGSITRKKVQDFQESKNLDSSQGIVGPKTYAALIANPVSNQNTDQTPPPTTGNTLNESQYIRIKNLMQVIK